MKILVICQYYFPEPFRVNDICEELVKFGHDVTVVTGTPNYPMGKIYPGYERGHKSDEIINGVKVHRCKIAPRRIGPLNRLRNYFSFSRASKKYVKKLSDDFDVVFVNQLSPVMMANAGIVYKRKYNKKLVLYCLDLWPESLCVGGIKNGSLIYKFFKRISRKIYRSVDTILVTSKMFEKYLAEKFGLDSKIIHYLPQYAESMFLTVGERETENDDVFNVVFAGNIGVAQGVETIIESAKLLQDEEIYFHIVGDGVQLSTIKERAKGLKKVVFYGRKPLETMPEFYTMADAMLVTFGDSSVATTLPGKVQACMAAGRAIVGAVCGETADVLRLSQGGYYGPIGDAQALAKNILEIKQSGRALEIGRANREFYLANFAKQKFFDVLQKHFD